ncbi:DUF3102 domain-containing protein, partial [Bacillus sp. C30]|uniref:DUF3102 domain-containing protein n=1 Tax=Bacillus sp. C30 TaxID=1387733 RepID=UPI00349F6695
MNKVINLSTDINVITAEIKSYQQIAGQSIFEIGKRLKHVKEQDLVHGEWITWLNEIGFSRSTAPKFIQAYEQFSNVQSVAHFGTAKIFQLISMPQEIDRQQFIEEPHMIPSTGEEKTVNEMTVKEIREVKKALKEKDKLLGQETERRKRAEQETFSARKSEELTRKQLEEREEQEPQIIEKVVVKTVEVESKNQNTNIKQLKDRVCELEEKLAFQKQKMKTLQKDSEELQDDSEHMNFMAKWTVHTFRAELEE